MTIKENHSLRNLTWLTETQCRTDIIKTNMKQKYLLSIPIPQSKHVLTLSKLKFK